MNIQSNDAMQTTNTINTVLSPSAPTPVGTYHAGINKVPQLH